MRIEELRGFRSLVRLIDANNAEVARVVLRQSPLEDSLLSGWPQDWAGLPQDSQILYSGEGEPVGFARVQEEGWEVQDLRLATVFGMEPAKYPFGPNEYGTLILAGAGQAGIELAVSRNLGFEGAGISIQLLGQGDSDSPQRDFPSAQDAFLQGGQIVVDEFQRLSFYAADSTFPEGEPVGALEYKGTYTHTATDRLVFFNRGEALVFSNSLSEQGGAFQPVRVHRVKTQGFALSAAAVEVDGIEWGVVVDRSRLYLLRSGVPRWDQWELPVPCGPGYELRAVSLVPVQVNGEPSLRIACGQRQVVWPTNRDSNGLAVLDVTLLDVPLSDPCKRIVRAKEFTVQVVTEWSAYSPMVELLDGGTSLIFGTPYRLQIWELGL